MSKEQLPALPAQIVNVAVNLDQNDVAAILMCRAEEHIKGQIKSCQAEETKLEKVVKDAEAQLEKELEEAAKTHFENILDTLKGAATTLGCKCVESKTQSCGMTDKVHNVYLRVTGTKPQIIWEVRAEAKIGAELKKTSAAITAANKAVTENKKLWMDWRRKLADLPMLERRAKAMVAEERLNQSVDGRALVAMLDAQRDSSIKLLGVN